VGELSLREGELGPGGKEDAVAAAGLLGKVSSWVGERLGETLCLLACGELLVCIAEDFNGLEENGRGENLKYVER
jgi:hypothetical protein